MMKRFSQQMLRAVEWLKRLVHSMPVVVRRTASRTEAREQKAREAERLDRLRNPGNYRGR